MLSNTVFAMKTKKDTTRKRKFRMHLRNRFFLLPQFGPGEVPVTLISTRCSYCLAGFAYQSRSSAGCQVLDSVLLLFLKHTNIWFSYKVPFKFLLAPNDDPAT